MTDQERARVRRSERTMGRGRRALLGLAVSLACTGLVACGGTGEGGSGTASDTAPAVEAPAPAETEAGAGVALLDPNDASPEALRGLAGLTEAAASALVEGRPFADMMAVDSALAAHMDSAARQDLYRRMWIPVSLNDASDREILLIPGVGDRMLGEFKEYRPYRSMEQWRREIGKYVNDEELSRLERYVRLGG